MMGFRQEEVPLESQAFFFRFSYYLEFIFFLKLQKALGD